MMSLGPIGFLSPGLLLASIVLPVIWWLLRVTPPTPHHIFFPATRLLLGINKQEQDKAHSPWWLTLLRLVAATALILALSRPVLNPQTTSLAKSDLLVVLIDNGWASAGNWAIRRETMMQRLEMAEQDNRPVILLGTANVDKRKSLIPVSAFKGREQFNALRPHPFAPNRLKALSKLKKTTFEGKKIDLIWLSDGLDYGHAAKFVEELTKLAQGASNLTIIKNPRLASTPMVLHGGISKKGNLQAFIKSPGGLSYEGHVVALDTKGRPVVEKPFRLSPDTTKASADFDLPLELRNQITRLEIKGRHSAGTTYLIDGRANWQRVGLISGEAVEESQPLLSPLYYIKKALKPYSEITTPDNRNTAQATTTLLSRDISTLILAGIGRLENSTARQLEDWLERGGILVRFAGPRLEQSSDDLLPVPLRQGGRTLGGALSWSKPQKLSPFETNSPFFGLQLPDDVSVKRQVLADPSQITDSTLIWARLTDGTPLVTARKRGRGLLVLFHVTANSTWSDLPHSGLFVDMLRRLTELSTGVTPKAEIPPDGTISAEASNKSGKDHDLVSLPPLKTLNGFGDFVTPDIQTEPVKVSELDHYMPSVRHPPGLYGSIGQSRALNIGSKALQLTPLQDAPKGVTVERYKTTGSTPLAPLLLAIALTLFLADGIIVALMRGLFAPAYKRSHLKKAKETAATLLIAGLILTYSPPLIAASEPDTRTAAKEAFALNMSLDTHLAYVKTGNAEIDRISHLGLTTLSRIISRRTAFEPSAPVGIDIGKDELAFFPLLYWAVPPNPKQLDSATLAKINAYMKQGGMILFDTRDQISSFLPRTRSGTKSSLARLLSRMDIPPLEPVPHDHVLTRSFYLLDSFPGRWSGGTLWVEATSKSTTSNSSSSARSADGVSSILITSNNLAAAWARDENGRTLYAVTPDGERQREMAYRTGINIIMYALTGNYKADQVHLPALMRRLGQ
jgi:hypothetical protein